MTCVFSVSSPDVLLQVSDRRLVWPDDGRVADDHANKVTVFDGRMAVSYSGLSKVLGDKTDEWLTRILSRPPIRSLADAVYRIRDRATETFRGWARRPSERARHHLIFGFIGWTRQSGQEDLRILVGFVSNCHNERGELQKEARDDFREHHKILRPDEPQGFLTTGVTLLDDERQRLDERVRVATNLDEFTEAYVTAVREIAARDGTVSKNVLAVTIPRAAVERTEQQGRASLVLGPPLTFDGLGSMYFPENGDPIQYGPNFVFDGTGFTGVKGGPL